MVALRWRMSLCTRYRMARQVNNTPLAVLVRRHEVPLLAFGAFWYLHLAATALCSPAKFPVFSPGNPIAYFLFSLHENM